MKKKLSTLIKGSMEVTVGGQTTHDLFKKLLKNGFIVPSYITSDFAGDHICEQEKLNVIFIAVKDLMGNSKPATLEQIIRRAAKWGLKMGPKDLPSHMRLQYPNQKKGEHFWVPVQPIKDNSEPMLVFNVGTLEDDKHSKKTEQEKRCYILSDARSLTTCWVSDAVFVFVDPKK